MEGVLSQLVSPPGPEVIARQERIAVRRARVNEKIAKRRLELAGSQSIISDTSRGMSSLSLGDTNNPTATSVEKDEEDVDHSLPSNFNNILQMQIDDSKKQLEQLILDGETLITNVKVAAEYREKRRHDRQDETRKQRILTLKEDAEYCQQEYEDISSKWLISAEKVLPLELYTKLKEQQDACDELLRKKDDSIESLRREIEENDYDYENDLEKYQKDVMLIGDRIDDHIDDLRKSFLEELELLEEYTCQDREFILEENQKEWLNLLAEFEEMEIMNLNKNKSDALGKFKILNEMYSRAKQGYRDTKHSLEDDLRILIQEVEQIKVICQMNLDKMEYNLHVLRRRENENRKLKNSLKRQVMKLQDKFSEKTCEYRALVVDTTNKSKRLIKDINRLEEQCRNGSRKTLELVTNDYFKYMELWIINEEESRAKLHKLVDSEKFIYETQLGIELPLVDKKTLDNRPLQIQNFMKRTKYVAPDAERIPSDVFEPFGEEFGSDGGLASQDSLAKIPPLFTRSGEIATQEEPVEEFETYKWVTEEDPKLLRHLMKHISKICDETGFIIEEKLRKILAPLQDLEQQLIRADSLFQALGINEVAQLEILAKYLLKYCKVKKTVTSKPPTATTEDSLDFSMDESKLKDGADATENQRIESLAIAGKRKDSQASTISEDVDNTTKVIESQFGIPIDDNTGDGIEEGDEDEDTPESGDNREEIPSLEPVIKNLSDESIGEVLGIIQKEEEEGGESVSGSSTSSREEDEDNADGTLYVSVKRDTIDSEIEGADFPEWDESGMKIAKEKYRNQNKRESEKTRESTRRYESVISVRSHISRTFSQESVANEVEGVSSQNLEELLGEDGEYIQEVNVHEEIVDNVEKDLDDDDDDAVDDGVESVRPSNSENSLNASSSPFASTPSIPTTLGESGEIVYIEPKDVIVALTEFCKDFNAEIKLELPNEEDIINQKLGRMQFPTHEATTEYWNRFYSLTDPKSKELWDSMQYCFENYADALKKRNKLIEEIVQLYQQNYELSHLLKKHLKRGVCFGSQVQSVAYINHSNLPDC